MTGLASAPKWESPGSDSSLHEALGPMNVNDTEGHRLEAQDTVSPRCEEKPPRAGEAGSGLECGVRCAGGCWARVTSARRLLCAPSGRGLGLA